jgi:hypothetical protein
MGNHELDNSTQEGVSTNILSRMLPVHWNWIVVLTVCLETNYKNLSSSRSLLHIPPLLFLNAHVPRVGLRVCRRLHANTTYNHGLYIWAFPPTFARDCDTVLLPCWAVTWARELITPRATEGPIQLERSRRRKRRAGIWILLGCCDTSICTSLGLSVRGAISVHATCRDRSLVSTSILTGVLNTDSPKGIACPLKLDIPLRTQLLLHYHFPRIQRPSLPTSH